MDKKLSIKEKIVINLCLFIIQFLAGNEYSVKEVVNNNLDSIKKSILEA